jgi:hypothetical protein
MNLGALLSQINSTIKMLTKDEAQFLKTTLHFFSKLKLVNFRFNNEYFETMDRKWTSLLSVLVCVLNIANICFCIWRMPTLDTQMRVLLIFQILISVVAILIRYALVKYNSEFVNIVNNIFKFDSINGG